MSLFTLSTILLLPLIISLADCQNVCQFKNSVEAHSSKWSYIENFSTGRCLVVENMGHFPNRKLLLEECSRKKPLREQKIYFESSPLGGFNLKVDDGMNQKYCLTTKEQILHNAECQGKNFDQTWRLKPVRGHENQFLIEQYSSKYCLIPSSRKSRSAVGLVPCNSHVTEQIWKVCTSNA